MRLGSEQKKSFRNNHQVPTFSVKSFLRILLSSFIFCGELIKCPFCVCVCVGFNKFANFPLLYKYANMREGTDPKKSAQTFHWIYYSQLFFF